MSARHHARRQVRITYHAQVARLMALASIAIVALLSLASTMWLTVG